MSLVATPALSAVYTWAMLTDPGVIDAPRSGFWLIVGGFLALPDAVRFLVGRLYPWRLHLSSAGLSYQGYRTRVDAGWSEIKGARVYRQLPGQKPQKLRGVVVDRRASLPDLILPAAAFTVDPQALADEIHRWI